MLKTISYAAGMTIHCWEVCEITLKASDHYENPDAEVTCWVQMQGPGFNQRVWCHRVGENGQEPTFRARYTVPAAGQWTWVSGSNMASNSGLNGIRGSFSAVDWTEEERGASRALRKSRTPRVRRGDLSTKRKPSAEKLHILLVNDNEPLCEVLKVYLESTDNFVVTVAANGDQALEVAAEFKLDLIVSDLLRPDEDVDSFLETVRLAHPSVPLVIFSGLLHPTNQHTPEDRQLQAKLRQLGVAASLYCLIELPTLAQVLLQVAVQSV